MDRGRQEKNTGFQQKPVAFRELQYKSFFMLDKLLDLVKNYAGDAVVQNPAIPNEKNEEAVTAGGSSIIATLQNALASGRLNDVLGYFKGGGNAGIVNEATNNYTEELQSKFGMNEDQAKDAASKVIPPAMEQLARKTNDPSDNSFDIQDIFNQLSGGKTGGIDVKGLLNRFGAGNLDKDNDGDVDLKDLQSMFAGGGAGGIIGGLFK